MTRDFKFKIGKTTFNTPVMVASGTYGYGEELADFMDPAAVGAIVTKTITPKPRAGNKSPRICETPAGMLNAIGLANNGIDYFIEKNLPYLAKMKTKKIISISADSDEDFIGMVQKLSSKKGVDALELNLSCPNLRKKVLIAQDAAACRRLIGKIRRRTRLPLIAKLTPNVTDIQSIAKACADAGADALSAINTYYGMAIDIEKCEPKIGNITGGLSGPAIRPAAVKIVWDISQVVKIPIIAIGGIMTWHDAIEYFMAGAAAIQVGTANYLNPLAPIEITKGIENFLKRHRYKNIQDLPKAFQKNVKRFE